MDWVSQDRTLASASIFWLPLAPCSEALEATHAFLTANLHRGSNVRCNDLLGVATPLLAISWGACIKFDTFQIRKHLLHLTHDSGNLILRYGYSMRDLISK